MRPYNSLTMSLFLALLLAAQDRGVVIVGKVQDPLGRGMPHALAELRSEASHEIVAQAHTDSSGVYQFLGVPPGGYALRLQAAGFASLTVKATQISGFGQTVLPPIALAVSQMDCGRRAVLDTLRVLPAEKQLGTFRGSIRIDQGRAVSNGLPVTDAAITLICAGGLPCGATKTDARGEFVFSGLTAGTFSVHVNRRGFYPLDESGFTVQNGYDALYWPTQIESCPRGDCDPRRRPKKPPVRCE